MFNLRVSWNSGVVLYNPSESSDQGGEVHDVELEGGYE